MFFVTDHSTIFSEIYELNEKSDDIKITIEEHGQKYATFLLQFCEGEKFPVFDTEKDAAKFIISCCEMEIKALQEKMEKLKKVLDK